MNDTHAIECMFQYQVIDRRLNALVNCPVVSAPSERTARRRLQAQWPAEDYRLHLIVRGDGSQREVEPFGEEPQA
ncbi:MAG TPA: hypothetical protein VF916_04785 [Ktedonobacterales bacterium]